MNTVFVMICAAALNGQVILSDKAGFACYKQEMPKALSDDTRFVNRGIGREFNILYANAEQLGLEE